MTEIEREAEAPEAEAPEARGNETVYLVQVTRELWDAQGETKSCWVDLGMFTAPSGNKRKAIERAMERLNIDEGDFRAIPEVSAEVFHPRVKKQITWL